MKTVITDVSTLSRPYLTLLEAFPLRPIRSDEGLARAMVVMRTLMGRELTEEEEDYLDVLGNLIETYEDEHHPIPAPSAAQVVRAMLSNRKVSQAEVARGANVPESTVSAILAGRRGISKACAVAFAKFFGVPADRFLID